MKKKKKKSKKSDEPVSHPTLKGIERKLPEFRRQESWRYKRVRDSWRRPRGIDSKMRRKVKGWPKVVSMGYRNPKSIRGLHPRGLREILVSSLTELEKLDPGKDAARLSSTLGRRKRIPMVKRAKELGIAILNPTRVLELKKEASSS